MKKIFRRTAFNAFSLFILPQIFSGVTIKDGLTGYILGGLVLSLINTFIKPIIHIISIPLNLITFGAFSFISNAIVLYLLTVLVPQIKIHAFTLHGFSSFGFVVPTIYVNTVFAYILAALTLSVISTFLTWVVEK